MTKTAFLFAGQGAQKLGMASDLYEKYPIVRETFDQASSILGYNLRDLIDKEEDKLLTQINKWFGNSNIKIYFTNNNTKYISEKSCIFDMMWDKQKTLNYIKKYSIKVLN